MLTCRHAVVAHKIIMIIIVVIWNAGRAFVSIFSKNNDKQPVMLRFSLAIRLALFVFLSSRPASWNPARWNMFTSSAVFVNHRHHS